jgi:bifunctional non-homologous end joining protein LigD
MTELLNRYWQKRDFGVTPEPRGKTVRPGKSLSFVIQKHAATRLHYDFRLELDGTLKSWAVPKGPSLDPHDKRMAVHVEDHPLSYGSFEGVIPPGQYGAGTVIVWDHGTWEPIGDPSAGYRAGKLKFRLHGEKLEGAWTLVRMHGHQNEKQEPWLLIKERDEAARPASEFSVVDEMPHSVVSGVKWAAGFEKKGKTASAVDPGVRRGDKAGKGVAASTAATKSTASKSAAARSTSSTPSANATSSSRRKSGSTALPDLPTSAKKAKLPATLSPQLATLVDRAPPGDDWVYEIKFDGYRILARIDGKDVRLFTRNGNDWTSRMKGLAAEVAALGLPSGWLDGEIVVPNAQGTPDFNALQNAFDSTHTERIQYYVFDLPFFDGHDLREVPLHERRQFLSRVLDGRTTDRIRFSEDFNAAPEEILQNACRLRLEGVIGKRRDSTYVSRRSSSWIKLKCTHRQEFVIVGYTDPSGSRVGIGSLLLAIHDEAGDLRYAGKVGAGFDTDTLGMIEKKLKALAADKTPLRDKPSEARGRWVQPTLVAEVSFGEWTPDGRIRHSVFHGLREDKPSSAITLETALPAKAVATKAADEAGGKTSATKASGKSATAKTATAKTAATKASTAKATAAKATPANKSPARTQASSSPSSSPSNPALPDLPEGVRISNPDRVIDKSTGITKRELVDYYLLASRHILPHLAKRPVALVRAPSGIQGELFFQKHGESLHIPDITKLDASIDPGHPALMSVDSFTALIGSAQMNVVEFHTWNAKLPKIDQPDRMTFDLDPGEGVSWKTMQEAAELARKLLEELGLKSFLKTSGGKGLHVVVPLTPRDDWDTVKDFSQAIVQHLSRVLPDRFSAKSGPKNRVGRIFPDYLRNGRGATTACAFSARARPGMGVSIPVSWDELPELTGGAHWTIRTAHERLESGMDPWADYGKTRQTLAKAMKILAGRST